ncbi:Uncharacterised protein [Candidatus Bilamarchaeum dharawalense]|uniref:HTH arsR-type domain-containing protein n=1 Tax=Candidatus Bilamarchaeum dharawalense TaxID=2885759 RepID=A0A5E4LPU8_9ARCH|nr:Uncharacterised protein [Candidatus Bilamarchaeum dharawalense]
MKLNKSELKILAFLTGTQETFTLGELASKLNIKKSNASSQLKKLEKFHLINSFRSGRVKQIQGSNTLFIAFSKVKETLPHIKLDDLLIGRIPYLLAYFYDTRSKRTSEFEFKISEIDLPNITSARLLAKLRGLGLIYQKSRGLYSIRKETYEALRFCAQTLTQMSMAEAEAELKGITDIRISFERASMPEGIFTTAIENSPKHYWPTAYTAMAKYGVPLISSGKYYYTNIKPKLGDIIIHLLALDRDARTIQYICVLMIKNSFEYRWLYKKESRFGTSDRFISELLEFIETKGQDSPSGFPSWGEVESMLKDYDVRGSAYG